ncbi:uncharacterized protein with ACT and thioredoxin-like domain [Cytobacillus eiseniae]|uniref:Uncharacterized protein with ACT and thioredoxin-like domain n=1 Tax=Cytobacillus eiseniae TaxID=762947 RepID=A0ABS4RC56_9BACI|nr:hypothetical protein [Cytobacillus eiseniae]MBP2240481.1 uncharacterized protein with ACT and thioredoxin-like domain [Cytobacillus eiseniae]
MKKKITASIFIFTFLFSSAWIIDQKGKREFFIPGVEEVAEIIPLNVNMQTLQNVSEMDSLESMDNFKSKRVKVFGAREYVRIQSNR